MVFRKPYAFFIKNFKRIHFLLVILCGFIYSKVIQLSSFNNDFLTYLSYDAYFEPISKYLNPLLYLTLFIVIISFMLLLIVLRRKEKPWKLYLIPIAEYVVLTIIFIAIGNFYNTYESGISTTTMRALDNFLSIATYPQYIVFLILIIRILGLDIKNFNFSADEEFLELDQDDREEFEISFDFDKHLIKRTIRKTKRELTYFYEEHRFICNIVFTILAVFTLYKTYYYFGVSHKTLKENKAFSVNNYSMMINKSFYTNKDKAGNVLEKNSAFVILNISVLNNGSSRYFDGNDFHIVNGSKNYTFQGNTYSDSFSDLGNSFPTGKIKNGQQKDFALIFKVDKNLDYKNFVLYYQEYKNNTTYLRKIKLNLENVGEIEETKVKNIGEELNITNSLGEETDFTFESFQILSSANYNVETCDQNEKCYITTKTLQSSENYKILYVDFSSSYYEGEDLIKFSTNYGKIKYVDTDSFTKEIEIKNFISDKEYLGKKLYIKVPANLENAKEIELIYTIRNKKYSYKIR